MSLWTFTYMHLKNDKMEVFISFSGIHISYLNSLRVRLSTLQIAL